MSNIVGVDVGGTFTDVYYFESGGEIRSAKSPSTSDTVTGVLKALEQIGGVAGIDSLSFGSTIATNALVQRRLARTGLLTTAGFRDVLDIRRLWRRDLFGHKWDRPEALIPRHMRLEACGRIDFEGNEIEPLNEEDVRAAAAEFREMGAEAVAVTFLFGYVNQVHERRAAEILAEELPDARIMISSEVNPERNEYERTSTTAIAAALAPVVDSALESVERQLLERGLSNPPRVMKSNGGVMSVRAARDKPVELVKSGPAGGASAGVWLSEKLNEPRLILIDIGGTTADASLIVDGRPIRANSDMVEWDIPIRVPVVDIRSVGAGGGSIAHLDVAGGLEVGPQSAGAEPGPVAYGKGGAEPTVTDAAIVSGLLDPDFFLAGSFQLDVVGARRSLEPISDSLGQGIERTAAAIMHVATNEMANLVREITIDAGLDPREFALVAFGGAGPLFVGSLLQELGLSRGFVPTGAATLSAMGGAFADVTFDYVRSEIGVVGEAGTRSLEPAFAELIARAEAEIEAEGLNQAEITTAVDMRYAGQWHEIEVEMAPDGDLTDAAAAFEAEHQRLWGHARPDEPIEFTAVRARVVSRVPKPDLDVTRKTGDEPAPKGHREVTFFGSDPVEIPIFDRAELPVGFSRPGPLIVEEAQTTSVVPEGFGIRVGELGEIAVER